jgi:acetyltransferase-like isoleucine patch superfamily enzyme
LIQIGNNTRITKGVQFITHDGGIWTLRKMGLVDEEEVKYGKIKIGNNCNISWNVIILPNVTIGNNCVIAAGAIVTKDIPDNMVYGGIPAKKIETIEEYYQKNKNALVKTYSLKPKDKIAFLKKNKSDLFR